MSQKTLKIKDKFTPIRTEWKQLYGYPLPVINKDGNVSFKGGKPQTRPADHFDLLLYSEIAGYACCFASPATLADSIGLYCKDADTEVVKRIARGAAVGIIKPSYQKVMGQQHNQLVLEIDFQRVKELALWMEEYRKSEKVALTQREISLRASTAQQDLLNYLQNYILDHSSNQSPDQQQNHVPDQLLDYPPETDTKVIDRAVMGERPQRVTDGSEDCSSTGREEREEKREEEDSSRIIAHREEKEALPPHVEGGHATVKDIFETYVNPLMQHHGWTYADIDAVVEEATGQRQKIKDIATQEQRDEVYQLFEYYMATRDKPEKKIVERRTVQRSESGGNQYIKNIFEIANKLMEEYAWEWSDINSVVQSITGKEQMIKEIETLEEQKRVAECLTEHYEKECNGTTFEAQYHKALAEIYGW